MTCVRPAVGDPRRKHQEKQPFFLRWTNGWPEMDWPEAGKPQLPRDQWPPTDLSTTAGSLSGCLSKNAFRKWEKRRPP